MYVYKDVENKKRINYSFIEEKNFKKNPVIHIPINTTITIAEIEQGDDFFITFDKVKEAAIILKDKIFQLSLLNNLGEVVYVDIVHYLNHIKNVPFALYKKKYLYYVLEDKTRENIEKIFADMYIKSTNEVDYLSYFPRKKTRKNKSKELSFSDIAIFPNLITGFEELLDEERMTDIFVKISSLSNLRTSVKVFDHFDIDTLRSFFFTLNYQLHSVGGSLPSMPDKLLNPIKADAHLTLRYHNVTFSDVSVVIFDDAKFIPFSVRANLERLYCDHLKKPFLNKLEYKQKNEA